MNYQWQINYFKDGKRSSFTFPAKDLSDAVIRWSQHTKNLIKVENIFSITNNHILTHCDECVQYPPYNNIMGDAICAKHKYRYTMGQLKKPCPMCAEEEGLCRSCGKPFDSKVTLKSPFILADKLTKNRPYGKNENVCLHKEIGDDCSVCEIERGK